MGDTTGQVKTVAYELTKNFYEYDGLSRPITVWQAPVDAVTNTPCLKTVFSYVGVTNLVEKSEESHDIWNVSYDI